MGGPAPDLGWGPQWLNLWKMDDWGYPYGPGNAHHFAMNRGDPEFFFDDPFFQTSNDPCDSRLHQQRAGSAQCPSSLFLAAIHGPKISRLSHQDSSHL